MRLRTAENLTDALDDALGWRKIELSVMRRVVDKSPDDRASAVLRASSTLLYAHWEGFIKQAGELYLNFVVHQGLRYRELAPNFLGLAFRAKLETAEATLKACLYTSVCNQLIADLDHRAKVPYKDVVDTGANLGGPVFRNILCLLGLDATPYLTKEKPIIDELLKIRNKAAHGKWISIDKESYFQFHDEILWMMENFRDQIEVATASRTYGR